MKYLNILIRITFLSLALPLILVSCEEENETFDFSKPFSNTIAGNIVEDMNLEKGDYLLVGQTIVKSGATLTIDAGTKIVALHKKLNRNQAAQLIVETGGKLVVNGTAENPVVFTSDTLKAGAWGGIIINGLAPVNREDANTPRKSFQGNAIYGGNMSTDNSGSIQYLRIEYAGDGNLFAMEMNGLGSETTIEKVEVYHCLRNAFGFNGGTVNAKYLFANGVGDGMFKWNYGWQGKGQFWIGYRNSDKIEMAKWAMGIIGNSGLDDEDETLMPISAPVLSNITLTGTGNNNALILLGSGTRGSLTNLVLLENNKAIQVRDSATTVNVNNELLEIDYASTLNSGTYLYHKTVVKDNRFEKSDDFLIDDAELKITSEYLGTTANGKDMSIEDSWFESTDYKGAVSANNNWTEGWTK